MLKLYGFPISNYFNRIKIALLEKGIEFEEVYAKPRGELVQAHSPAGRIPFIEIDGQYLAESTVILEFLEERFPDTPMLPGDAWARARARELTTVMDLYLETPARRLYDQAFSGGTASEETKTEVRKALERGVQAFTQLAKFSPYIAGDQYSFADVTASVHLPLVSIATKLVLGEDVLAGVEPLRPYLKMLGERPAIVKVNADRKAATAKK